MRFGALRYRFKVEGILPERALLRLKRAGIALYNAKKVEKNVILFSVKKKDIEKVFAIYPNLCYNREEKSLYTVQKLGGERGARIVDFFRKRAGFLLGGLAFAALTLAADGLVFGVEIVGSRVYAREVMQALDESDIKLYAPYKGGKEDLVTAKLLSLQGVEFCSVQKVGNRVRVEMRTSPFTTDTLVKESMTAKHDGQIVQMSVLRGTALKKTGDSVTCGEPLVGNWFTPQEGEQVRVEPIARVRIACTYEGIFSAQSEEEAFAKAYLALALADGDGVTQKQITQTGKEFHVKISYLVTERINL